MSLSALFVVKRPKYERYVERFGFAKDIPDDIQVYLDKEKAAYTSHNAALTKLKAAFEHHNISYDQISRDEISFVDTSGYDAVITFGGDGTLLSTSHYIMRDSMSIIGIRSTPSSVGYLCASDYQHVETFVEEFVNGRISFIKVRRLQAKIKRMNSSEEVITSPVLNELLFSHENPAATTRYQIEIDGVVEEQKSSGIWISAPAGSTAATMAAGGVPLKLEDRNCQYIVREPFMVNGMVYKHIKGVFVLENTKIKIRSLNEAALVAVDGQHACHPVRYGDEIILQAGPDLLLARPI